MPPHQYAVYVSPTAEYILGVDVLYSLTMQMTLWKFWLHVSIVKTVQRGNPHSVPLVLPQATCIVNIKQYWLPGG